MCSVAIALGAVSALGSLQAGFAEGAAADANAQLAEYEAARAEQLAEMEAQRLRNEEKVNRQLIEDKTRADEADVRIRARRVLGAQRAAAGASGVGASGSPMDVLAASRRDAELDAMRVRYAGATELQALSYGTASQIWSVRTSGSTQAFRYRSQASLDRARGRQARIGGVFGAATRIGTSVNDYLNSED